MVMSFGMLGRLAEWSIGVSGGVGVCGVLWGECAWLGVDGGCGWVGDIGAGVGCGGIQVGRGDWVGGCVLVNLVGTWVVWSCCLFRTQGLYEGGVCCGAGYLIFGSSTILSVISLTFFLNSSSSMIIL